MNDPAVKFRRIKSVSLLLLLTALPALWLGVAQEDDWGWAKRDTWQRPAEVMDALGLKLGSVVADVGCGDSGGRFARAFWKIRKKYSTLSFGVINPRSLRRN